MDQTGHLLLTSLQSGSSHHLPKFQLPDKVPGNEWRTKDTETEFEVTHYD